MNTQPILEFNEEKANLNISRLLNPNNKHKRIADEVSKMIKELQ